MEISATLLGVAAVAEGLSGRSLRKVCACWRILLRLTAARGHTELLACT